MKIAAINGSPKTESISALIINKTELLLGELIDTYQAIRLARAETDTVEKILDADALLIVFPLFVDSMPSPLIELLTRLEGAARNGAAKPRVYTVVNGGLDSAQTALALEMVEHFACRAGLPWGYGIGIGAGFMLYNAGESWEDGLASDVYRALRCMTSAIKNKGGRRNTYVTPKFPRFLYRIMANYSFWREAKKNGVTDLRLRPYTSDK